MRARRRCILAVLCLLALARSAAGEYWIGTAGNNDWNTAGNWSPATVPNSATAFAGFYAAGGPVNISTSVQAASLTFYSSAGGYLLTSSASQTLSGVTSITVSSSAATMQQINLAPVPSGSLLFPLGSNLSISNSGTLVIGPSTVIGTTGSGGIVVSGPGTTTFSGSFYQVTGGLIEQGPGTTVLSGDGANLLGGLAVGGATVRLDYSVNPATKLGGGSLSLAGSSLVGGSVLSLVANAGAPVTQAVPGGTLFGTGQAIVTASGTGTLTLAAGAITRAAGATADLSPQAGSLAFGITTSSGLVNGLLGTGPAFATVGGGQTWATVVNGNVVGLDSGGYGVNTFTAGTNVDVTATATVTGVTANSLRFGAGNLILTLSGTNTIQSGGILVTPSATGGTITGGTLTVAGGGELIVQQYSGSPFTISSALAQAGGLTKAGAGTLILGGTNTYAGGTLVSGGTLQLGSASALPSNQDVVVNAGAVLSNGGLSNASGNAIGTLVLNGGTFAAPNGNTDFYLNKLVMTNGAVDATGSSNFGFHFVETGAGANINSGSSLWAGSNSRFVNNTGAPLTVNVSPMAGQFASPTWPFEPTLTVGAILSGAGSNSSFMFGGGGVVRLSNTHNTADITAVTTYLLSNDLSTNVGAGAFGTLGTGTITLGYGLFYDGPTATCAKPLTIESVPYPPPYIGLGGKDSSHVAGNLTLAGPLTGPGQIDFVYAGTYAPGSAVILTGTNTYSGGTGVDCLLQVGNGGTTGTLGTGDLYIDDLLPIGSVTFNRSDNITFGGNVSDTGQPNVLFSAQFTKAGSNTLTLTGTYTVSGVTMISGGTLALNSPATYTLSSSIRGAGALSKGGAGTLTLTGLNTYSGGTVITGGTLQIGASGALPAHSLTIAAGATLDLNGFSATVSALGGAGTVANSGSPLATLAFTGLTTTACSISMGGGTITTTAGKTVTFNGGQVSNAYLDGPGGYATGPAGAQFVNVTSTPATAITSNNGADTFRNFNNSAALTVAPGINTAGTGTNVTFNNFVNQGLGAVTVSASSQVNVSNFQSYGTVTLAPGTTPNPTQMTNLSAAPLGFNTGSRTFISVPANAGAFDAGIDLHGQNAVVAGGLFVNNGYVVDSVNDPMHAVSVIADYGSLVKGAGFYQNSVQTINGGKFQSGNSPGKASFGSFTFGPGGVSNYVFAIDDATGTAGPSPDSAGHVSGWGLVTAIQRLVGSATTSGDFTWTADSAHPLTVVLDTLVNPTTVGTDIAGPMADFDAATPYAWLAASWAGTYIGPTDLPALNAATAFDTSGFANPVAGSFGWSLDKRGHSLSLTYTPSAVPEPGTFGLFAVGSFTCWRRCQRRPPKAR